MRRQWRRRAGQGALLALLLQLVLPFLTVQQAIARPGLDAPFVICTSAGLVWIDADGKSAESGAPGGGQDDTAAHHCPVCFAKQLSAALVPAALPLLFAEPVAAVLAAGISAAPSLASSAPPLPARGPPVVG